MVSFPGTSEVKDPSPHPVDSELPRSNARILVFESPRALRIVRPRSSRLQPLLRANAETFTPTPKFASCSH